MASLKKPLVATTMKPCWLLIIVISLLVAPQLEASDQISAVTFDRGNAARTLVGIIRSESPEFVLQDLRTNQDLTFEKSEIRKIRRDIGEDSAARLIGVAPILAWKLTDRLPEAAKAGKVATVDGRSVYVTFGENSGIKAKDKLVVYRQGKVIVNPDTGDALGQERRKVAELLVTSVEEKYSKTLFATDIEVELKPGDLVEPASAKNALAVFPLVDQRQVVTKGGVQIAEELTSALVTREVTVVERIRLLDAMKELNLQQIAAFDEKTVQKVGNHLGAFAIVTGSITHSRTSSKVNIRVIEVATGKVLFAQTFTVGNLDTTPAVLFGATSSAAPASQQNRTNPNTAAEILTSSDWVWTKPGRYGLPVNTDSNEISPYLSLDGRILMFASDRPGGEGGWDLWMSDRVSKSAPWNRPVNLGSSINSKWRESDPHLSADGLTIYFSSDRPGGMGEIDLWTATRPTRDSNWSQPVNLGPDVNHEHRDNSPHLSTDELTLYFATSRNGGFGGTDIWMAQRKSRNSEWNEPVNLDGGINTSSSEGKPAVSPDGLVILFTRLAERPTPHNELWIAARRSTDHPFGNPQLLMSPSNEWSRAASPAVTADGRLLVYFSNYRGSEGWDLWWSKRVPKQ